MNSILHYRYRQKKPFSSYFPSGTSALALDLISRMLQFHPDDRISVENALEHPYLSEYHIQMPEPICNNLFNFEFEKVNYDLSSTDVQHLMYEEMLLYRPDSTHFPPYEKSKTNTNDNQNINSTENNNCNNNNNNMNDDNYDNNNNFNSNLKSSHDSTTISRRRGNYITIVFYVFIFESIFEFFFEFFH